MHAAVHCSSALGLLQYILKISNVKRLFNKQYTGIKKIGQCNIITGTNILLKSIIN